MKRKRILVHTIIMLMIIATIPILTGCKSIKQNIGDKVENKVKESLNIKNLGDYNKQETVIDNDGNEIIIGEINKLPDWWPDWITITKDAEILTAVKSEDGSEMTVQYTSLQEYSSVFDIYRKLLEDTPDFYNLDGGKNGNVSGTKNGIKLKAFIDENKLADMNTSVVLIATNEYKDNNTSSLSNNNNQIKDEDNSKDGDIQDDVLNDIDNKVVISDTPKQESLPKNFPTNVVPIIPQGVAFDVQDNSYNGLDSYRIQVFANKNIKDAYDFYNKSFNDMENKVSNFDSSYSYITGDKGVYNITICINPDIDNSNACTIFIECNEMENANSKLDSLDTVSLPNGYPSSIFPIINGGKIYNPDKTEEKGNFRSYVEVACLKSLEEISNFYESKIPNITDKERNLSTDEYSLSGYSGGYYFSIFGYYEELNGTKITYYSISIEKGE